MEIHYIWVYNSGHLKKREINLSSKYFIKLDIAESAKGRLAGKLSIKLNVDYIPDFFEKPNIKSVSGIIGKNGAGKTSILNYIKSHFPEGLEANMLSDLVVYSIEESGEFGNYVVYPSDWILELEDESGLFGIIEYDTLAKSTDTFRFTAHLSQADYIYYSFFVDYNSELTDWHGLKNISTSALLVEERTRIIQENISLNPTLRIQDFATDLDYLTGNEIAKAVQFLISPYKNILPFYPPRTLLIYIDKTDRFFFQESNSEQNDVFNLISILEKSNEKEQGYVREINSISIALLINLLVTERKYSPNMSFSHDFTVQKDEPVRSFILRFFQGLKEMGFRYNNQDVSNSKYEELSALVPEFINYFEELVNQQFITLDNGFNQPGSLAFHLFEKSDEAFKKLMGLYLKIKGLTPFLSFRWRGLSTGEQSFLSLVSRFHHLKHHEIGSDNLKSNLVILIDEGDAGYHPEWQRKFFKNTLDFLSSLFAEHQLQLIFTANAPFLTSDLPKYCITFIEKKSENELIIHDKENNRSETFGSNIHTLFSDSFYMEGALIGAFAKDKIDSIIKYLNDATITEQNDNYKKTISLIGEPLLRNKLQSMWNEKFGLSEELQSLLKRVKEIEGQIANKKNIKRRK